MYIIAIVVFGKAVQTLAKIGDEISIEPTFNAVSLSPLSAYIT